MRRLAQFKQTSEIWHELDSKTRNLADLIELAATESDLSMEDDFFREANEIEQSLEELEFRETLGGEYDDRNALMAIHAGAGGTESQDWAEMLLRMYLRWAEKRQFSTEILETSPGDEAGIKSTLLEINGDYAYGYLKSFVYLPSMLITPATHHLP